MHGRIPGLRLLRSRLRPLIGLVSSSRFHKRDNPLCLSQVIRWLTARERSDEERLCFNLNLYNLMTLHGLVARGPPSTTVSSLIGRGIFQASVKYAVGTLVLDITQVHA